MHPSELSISDFSYELPDDRIARHPLAERDQSKLLVYRKGKVSETVFAHIDELLGPGDLLVLNQTRVVHARLMFEKPGGATIEIMCLEPHSPADAVQSFASTSGCEWTAMVGNAKRWKDQPLEKTVHAGAHTFILKAEKIEKRDDVFTIRFSWDAPVSFSEVIHEAGVLPLPPYLNREAEDDDEQRYQTVYAREEGSVAAPTAGLHFTDAVLARIRERKADTAFVTLHVGAGTFKPVKSETMSGHVMHEEHISVNVKTIQKIAEASKTGRLIAVGTTTLRTLESIYWYGVQLLSGHTHDMHTSQWEPYEQKGSASAAEAFAAVANHVHNRNEEALHGTTSLLMAPPYEPRVAQALVTNFHQPNSTLLLLVAAFTGNDWKRIYDYALAHEFRFLSYGDSSILFR